MGWGREFGGVGRGGLGLSITSRMKHTPRVIFTGEERSGGSIVINEYGVHIALL